MTGTPPNCRCPSNAILVNGACQACQDGRVAVNGTCQCPKGTGIDKGECRKCGGGRKAVNGVCKCPAGTIPFPDSSSHCVKGNRTVCVWRGTAPFCDGSCLAGEEYRGGGRTSTEQNAGPEYRGGFGSSCATGSKVLCCHPAP
jgi:hypothetical protein